MVLERDIDRVGIVIGSNDAANVSEFRHVANLLGLAPVLAAVFSYLEQPVIQCRYRSIHPSLAIHRWLRRCRKSRRLILGYCVHALDLAHHRQLVAIEDRGKGLH